LTTDLGYCRDLEFIFPDSRDNLNESRFICQTSFLIDFLRDPQRPMISTTEMLRHRNRAHVLAGLRELGPSAHTTLSEWSGLSSGSVSAITAELEEEGVLQRVEQVASSGRGRPRVLFGPNTEFAKLAMIRVATESVEYSLIDYAGVLRDRFTENRPANEKSIVPFIKRLNVGIDRLAERSGLHPSAISTVSITHKGVVDPTNQTLLWSPVFDDQAINFPAVLDISETASVYVHNETAFGAEAVARRLRHTNSEVEDGRRIAVLSLGHAIGLGVATLKSHGRIEAFSPPFGHMVDQREGPLCRCGAHGCVEATAGFYGILRNAFGVPSDTLPAPFVPSAEVDKLAANARRGERTAEVAFRDAGDCLGLALARLNSLLSISEVTVTGHGCQYLDLLLPRIEQSFEQTMQARQGQTPKIHVDFDESQLVHDGNAQWSLAVLDEQRVATRLLSGVQVAG